MAERIQVYVLTLFPEMFEGPLTSSLLGKALNKNLWSLNLISLRNYGLGKHLSVDDVSYGGGPGMIIRPDVVDAALSEYVKPGDHLIYLTPRGTSLTQQHLQKLSTQCQRLFLLCGRYEGVDQRVLEEWSFEEISIGDFVVCGGEIPAMLLIEGFLRLVPGVVGDCESLVQESFSVDLLEYPQYTKPREWKNRSVPDILVSGHHQHIQQWRLRQSQEITQKRRPDLWEKYQKRVITE
jgi:tRNA (guanine37-N1)-methyltransferase